ncbi:MAG: carbon-nitrogen hydrolase family protein [Candidatus Poribacteria bacterium]
MPTNTVRVAAVQMLTGEDVEANAQNALALLERAAEDGARIVAFPEGCLFGYTCRVDYWEAMDPARLEAAEVRVAEAAGRLGVAVVIGSAHRSDGAWYNDLAIFDETGSLQYRYAKTFLAGEPWCLNNRGELPIVRLAGVDCCFIICHDVRYPELVRLPAAAGAQLCVFCSCESGLMSEYKLSAYRAMPISRATENGIYLLMANTPADPDDLRASGSSHGNSKIIHPDGNVLTEAGFFGDEIVSATLDLKQASASTAKRTATEDTILREWFLQGTEFVVRVGEDR